MTRALALALLLASCGRGAPDQPTESAGAALERAAVTRGIVADPAEIEPVGLYRSESDTVCVTPRSGGYRLGAALDYGEGQGCVAVGVASGRGTLDVRFDGRCRFRARVEGDRIAFPALLPAACDRFCTGRASLAALTGERISASAAEAASAVGPDGARLCP